MAKKKPPLISFSADELMTELRLRESGAPKSSRKGAKQRALAKMDAKTLHEKLRNEQKVIYGTDDRIEVVQITDSAVKENAEAVAGIFDVSDLDDNGDGTSTIRTVSFGNALSLCSSEAFRNQPTAPHCTAFLVGKNLIATAGHCLNGTNLGRKRFIFGFRTESDGSVNTVVSNDEIYKGLSILEWKLEGSGADYALVKLDRAVEGRPIVSVRRTGKVADAEKLYVIGHPSGLPAKFADDANVRENSATSFSSPISTPTAATQGRRCSTKTPMKLKGFSFVAKQTLLSLGIVGYRMFARRQGAEVRTSPELLKYRVRFPRLTKKKRTKPKNSQHESIKLRIPLKKSCKS